MKNIFEVCGDTTIIEVNGRDRARFNVLIDTADLTVVDAFPNHWRACWMKNSDRYYIATTLGKRSKVVLLHRAILAAPAGILVDHVNNDTFDNRRKNLRLATYQENARNQSRAHRGSVSPYKGVVFHRRTGKWQAQIKTDGRNHYLGLFTDPATAALAYDRKAIDLFGEFANTNFPIGGV